MGPLLLSTRGGGIGKHLLAEAPCWGLVAKDSWLKTPGWGLIAGGIRGLKMLTFTGFQISLIFQWKPIFQIALASGMENICPSSAKNFGFVRTLASKISEFWTYPNPCVKDFRILDLPEPLRQRFHNFEPSGAICNSGIWNPDVCTPYLWDFGKHVVILCWEIGAPRWCCTISPIPNILQYISKTSWFNK